MKKIIWGLLATITGVVLLLSYRTSLDAVAPTASAGSTGTGPTGTGGTSSGASNAASGSTASSTPSSSPSASASASSGPGSSASGLNDGTFTGAEAETRYGPVQVRITVSGGRITDVQVPEYPTESQRDQQINSTAVPQLVTETKDAQSAKIDMVSGATYTSEGYLQSLQSALDQAM
jgi:uncharacterized protein with FMN-binding domain